MPTKDEFLQQNLSGEDPQVIESAFVQGLQQEIRTLNGYLKSAKNKNTQLEKRLDDLQEAIDLHSGLQGAERPPKLGPLSRSGKTHKSVAVIQWSDWHVAEKVDSSKVDGRNHFNPEVCRKRVEALAHNTLLLVDLERQHCRVDEAILHLGGDFVTGYLHEELAQTNCMGTAEESFFALELLEQAVGHLLGSGGFKKVRVVCNRGNHGRCHDAETELLTKRGWKKYDELIIGEEVGTYNTLNKQTEFQALEDIHVSQFEGEMLSPTDNRMDFLVTPNHRIIMTQNRTEESHFFEAQDVDNEDIPCRNHYHMPKSGYGKSLDYGIEDSIIKLLGWIVTDGGYEYDKATGKPTAARIYQSKRENLQKIRDLLNENEIPFSEAERERPDGRSIKGVKIKSQMTSFTFSLLKSPSRDRLFSLLPVKNKLPEFFWDFSQRQAELFLASCMQGDGHMAMRSTMAKDVKGLGLKRVLYGTKEFLEQVQSLMMMNGTSSRLRKDCRGDHALQIHSGKRQNFPKTNPMEKVPYNGTVWCGTVKNGTLITRRNGIVLISGNSTRRVQFKNDYETSHESMIYWVLQKNLSGDNVDWLIPKSDICTTEIAPNRWARFIHGHQIKYAGGVGGISIPLKKWVYRQDESEKCLKTYLGHFHSRENSANYSINSSLKGWDEYARSIGFPFEEPTQSIEFFDLKHDQFTTAKPIFCE